MNATAENPTTVLDDTFIDLIVNGHSTRIEAFEALDGLRPVERRHESDANECQDCGRTCGYGAKCPACGSEALRASKVFRDDLTANLRRECGLPEISGRTAMDIYRRIIEVVESKKTGVR